MRIAGSWTIARPFGVPLRVHWSVPVCAFLAGGLRIAPGAWLAFLLLVLVHEAGHALVVRRTGARITALELLGFGGLCRWEGHVTPLARACIAWGGVWAQLAVLAVTGAALLAFGAPSHPFAAQMVDVATVGNLWLMGVNLLPIRPLDGEEAWALFPLLRRRLDARRAARQLLQGGASGGSPGLTAARGGRVTIAIPRIAPPSYVPPPAHDDAGEPDSFGEDDYTPEVREVLERTRAIAREAARDPTGAGRPGSEPDPG